MNLHQKQSDLTDYNQAYQLAILSELKTMYLFINILLGDDDIPKKKINKLY